jgi:hypothetical protein
MVIATRFALLYPEIRELILKPNRLRQLKVPYQNVIGGMKMN